MDSEIPIGGKYLARDKIGSGSFGEVFNGVCIGTNENVALKIERIRSVRPQLENEYRIIRNLHGGIGFPRAYWYGVEAAYNAMATELLGLSLESLHKQCKSNFSLKTILMLADQGISRLEYLHSKFFIHRDIKPENFLIGLGRKSHVVHLIDFGLSKRYIDPANNKHIKYKEGKSLTGTARYVSVFTHLGIEQARRDDLESFGYMLIYLARGSLPWMGIMGKSKNEKYKLIGLCKAEKSLQELCYGLPQEFENYLSYCRALKFEQKPDYANLKRMFKEAFNRGQYVYDYIFDWDIRRTPSPRKTSSFARERKEKRDTESTLIREITPFENCVRRDYSPIKELNGKKETLKIEGFIRDPHSLLSTIGAFPTKQNSPIKTWLPLIDPAAKRAK